MDPSRDNPFIRFQAFWWGIGSFLLFVVLLGVIWLFNLREPETLEDIAADRRLEIRAEVDAAQTTAISAEALDAAITSVSRGLATQRPLAVELPAQIIPGSATALALADGPGGDIAAVDAATDPDATVDPEVMALGQAQYLVCGACHGQNGEGGPAGPPLAGSEWVTGPVSNLIRIQLRGLVGPIKVAGIEYDFPAGMMAMAYQSDEQVAAVLTYVRNSFGNQAPPVSPEQVSALRGEVGMPPVTVDDLIDPLQ
jgi:mono/diheme cytochrome c family protein